MAPIRCATSAYFFSGDKESHRLGADTVVGEWLGKLGNPGFGLNADGIGLRVADDGTPIGASMPTGEKGYADYNFIVRNPGGHSGTPRPDNAIYTLARALERLNLHSLTPLMIETTQTYFEIRQMTAPAPLAEATKRWLANPDDRAAADAIEAGVGEIGLTRTRCVATAGYVPIDEYLAATAARTAVIAPIEDAEALNAIEAIAAEEGIDALFIGRIDLTIAHCTTPDEPRVVAAVNAIVAARRRAGRTSGMFRSNAADVVQWREKGVRLCLLASDSNFTRSGVRALRTEAGM